MRIQEFLNEVAHQQGVAEGTENRCQQCGMKNCKCPGDTCKCKPIAGWVPGKGFAKAREEAALNEKWSQKYKSSINCSHPKGFSQKAHCAGKKKHNESAEMEMVCEDCGMCQTHGSLNEIKKGQKDSNGYTRCWPGKHAEGTKKGKNGGQVRNCVPNESQGMAEGQLNELDFFAPVTTFIKMTNGSYIQADWRKSQGNPGLSDSASFVNFKPVNPTVAKQLGLDSHQRNNSISNPRDGTIVPGGPIQGSGPLANRGYEVVDYNKPETMKELPPEIKSELIKWVQKQGVAEGEGNFAGDTPVNIGGATVKRLGVGDTVTYFGRRAKIIGMSKTGNTSRIAIANNMGGITQDVLTSDLKRASQ